MAEMGLLSVQPSLLAAINPSELSFDLSLDAD